MENQTPNIYPTAIYLIEGLSFVVIVKQERKIFGRSEVLIQPINGSGEKWVTKQNVNIYEHNDVQ